MSLSLGSAETFCSQQPRLHHRASTENGHNFQNRQTVIQSAPKKLSLFPRGHLSYVNLFVTRCRTPSHPKLTTYSFRKAFTVETVGSNHPHLRETPTARNSRSHEVSQRRKRTLGDVFFCYISYVTLTKEAHFILRLRIFSPGTKTLRLKGPSGNLLSQS
jgi:hypothetical protein